MGMTKITIRTVSGDTMEVEADEFEHGFAVHPSPGYVNGEARFVVTDVASGCRLTSLWQSADGAIAAFHRHRLSLGDDWEGVLSEGREKARRIFERQKQGEGA